MARKRNPNGFTTDEIRTADLIITEGTIGCWTSRPAKGYEYRYPFVEIRMCDKHALEAASRTLGVKLGADRTRIPHCKPQDFPPDGRGLWRVRATAKTATKAMQRLDPLLTPRTRQRWQQILKTCT